MWEISTGKEINALSTDRLILSVAFRADNKVVALADSNTIYIVETISGNEINSITYDGFVFSVAWSPDGRYVAAGVCDIIITDFVCTQSSIHVSEISSGRDISRTLQDRGVIDLSFSTDGKYLVSVDSYGLAHL